MRKSYYDTFGRHPFQDHFNEANLNGITAYDNTVILDLIDTFFSICYYDFYTERNEDSGKIINLEVPVCNFNKFNKIKDIINNLVMFMTNGEKWDISFKKSSNQKKIEIPSQLPLKYNYDSIALLSGGLDALAGAAQEKNNNTIFVTFASNKIEKNKAINSYNNYVSKYCDNSTHVIINKKALKDHTHLTQRTRSLIFLSSCFIYADYYNINTIKIYENGIMTLNPTFFFRRKVTRTTHPKTLYLINKILEKLGIKIKIINPFNYYTKAEVIDLIPLEWDSLISNTKTCSKMPGTKAFQNYNGHGFNHCGICAACILRQISIANSNNHHIDVNYILPENLLNYENIINYEYANGDSKNRTNSEKFAIYRFVEKKSLIQYYILFNNSIKNKDIYKYLNLNPKFFYNDKDYVKKYERMLHKFSNEIELYIKKMK